MTLALGSCNMLAELDTNAGMPVGIAEMAMFCLLSTSMHSPIEACGMVVGISR